MHPAERYAGIVEDPTAFRSACDRPLPTVVRVNTVKATPRHAIAALEAGGVDVSVRSWRRTVLELDTDRPGNTWPYVIGWIHGQEEVSQLPVVALDPQPGERVFDAAAAPGGKATQIAAMQGDRGLVVANDVNVGRLAALRANADRLGVTSMAVTSQDSRVYSVASFDFDAFDRALVDAPCSGEGTIRKNPTALDGWSEAALAGFADQQTGMLRRAVELTRPGGTVVYATCTFAPEENEQVLTRVVDTTDCAVEPFDIPLEHAPGVREWQGDAYDPSVRHAKRFYPHHTDTGGFFCAKLRVGS